MSDAKRFRDRATECRDLAKGARLEVDRTTLEELAVELDTEADNIDTESEAPPGEPTDVPSPMIEDSQIAKGTNIATKPLKGTPAGKPRHPPAAQSQ